MGSVMECDVQTQFSAGETWCVKHSLLRFIILRAIKP